jgi:hypothetical protein
MIKIVQDAIPHPVGDALGDTLVPIGTVLFDGRKSRQGKTRQMIWQVFSEKHFECKKSFCTLFLIDGFRFILARLGRSILYADACQGCE